MSYPKVGYSWCDPVAGTSSLPTVGNNLSDVRMTLDQFLPYIWNGSAWVAQQASANPSVLVFTSAAGAGGAATEVMTLTGLKTSDTIISVSQKTKGANSLPLLGWSTQVTDHLTGIWSADPGAGAIILVAVTRSA